MASLQSIPEFSSVDVRIAVQKLLGGGSLLLEVVSSEDDMDPTRCDRRNAIPEAAGLGEKAREGATGVWGGGGGRKAPEGGEEGGLHFLRLPLRLPAFQQLPFPDARGTTQAQRPAQRERKEQETRTPVVNP